MNKYVSIVLILLNIQVAYAQKNHLNGWVLTTKKDTIQGRINYVSNQLNTKKCEFISNDSIKITYTPSELIEYEVFGRGKFVSKEINLNDSTRLVFLEYLIKGTMNLFLFTEESINYYFVEKSGILYQLSNAEKEYINEYGTKYLKNSKEYIGVLNFLMNNSPDIQQQIMRTPYTTKHLTKLIEDYHYMTCTDGECVNYVEKAKVNIDYEVISGIRYHTLKLRGSSDKSNCVSPTFGMNLILSSSNANTFLKFRVGLSFTRLNFDRDHYINEFLRSGQYHYSLKYNLIEIPFGIEYELTSRKIVPTVYLGIRPGFGLNMESKLIEDNVSFEWEVPLQPFKVLNGFEGGVGVNIGISEGVNITVKTSFELNIPIANNNNYLDYRKIFSKNLIVGLVF